jgi:transcriptional regulator
MSMNRRALLAGMAMAGVRLEAQHASESLYIPKPHLVEDRRFLHDFMDEFSFVDLVTAAPTIRITHIPMILDRSIGKYGAIYGHISRQNPQSKTFDGRQPAVIVFRGPHSYISPTWYAKTEVVPTWNFAVVHASGTPKPIDDKKAMHDLLAKLIHKFETSDSSAYDFAKLPDKYKYGLIAGIIGFEMEIELLEGKFKLGQERSDADKTGVLKGLQNAKPQRSIHDFTASFYERFKAPAG